MGNKKREAKSEQGSGSSRESATQKSERKKTGVRNRLGLPFFRITLLFSLYMIIFHVVLYFVESGILRPMQKSITLLVSYLLNSIGIVNTAHADTLRVVMKNDTWSIDIGCTAIDAMVLYCAFVLAYTSSARSKLAGIFCGIPFIAVTNVLRLVALGWVTEYYPSIAHLFHDYVFETVFLFIIIAMWFIWIEQAVKHEKNPAISR